MQGLVIRAEQMSAFEEDLRRRWLCDCITSAYPEAAKGVGDRAIRDLVDAAARSARSYGFKTDLDLAAYVRTAFLLGVGFDADPALPWALEILKAPRLRQPGDRAWTLESTALKFVAGKAKAAAGGRP